MYYWPTMQDIYSTLPPGEQTGLAGLIAEHPSEDDTAWGAEREDTPGP